MTEPSRSAKRILIVDDHSDTREMLHVLLEQSGYGIKTADSIAVGLRLAKAERFDLYILDNWLSDGTGVELCQHLRALHSSTQILFYSGAAYEADIEQAMRAGADEYLVKPCDIEQVQQTVTRLLQKSSPDTSQSRREGLRGTIKERS